MTRTKIKKELRKCKKAYRDLSIKIENFYPSGASFPVFFTPQDEGELEDLLIKSDVLDDYIIELEKLLLKN